MIKLRISKNKELCIHEYEEIILNQYKKAAEVYLPTIEKMKCTLKISLGLSNVARNIWSASPILGKTSYECFVYCMIQKEGKEVRVSCEDGEVDYFPLIGSWMISDVILRFGKFYVTLWPEVDTEFKTDMEYLLEQLSTKRCYTSNDVE